MIIYDGKTKRWNSFDPLLSVDNNVFTSSSSRRVKSASNKSTSCSKNHDSNQDITPVRLKPSQRKHDNDIVCDNEGELDEEDKIILNEKIQNWLATLDADASRSFMRREVATVFDT